MMQPTKRSMQILGKRLVLIKQSSIRGLLGLYFSNYARKSIKCESKQGGRSKNSSNTLLYLSTTRVMAFISNKKRNSLLCLFNQTLKAYTQDSHNRNRLRSLLTTYHGGMPISSSHRLDLSLIVISTPSPSSKG